MTKLYLLVLLGLLASLPAKAQCISVGMVEARVRAELGQTRKIEHFVGGPAMNVLRRGFYEIIGDALRDADEAIAFSVRMADERATAAHGIVLFKDGCAVGEGIVHDQIWTVITAETRGDI